MVQDRGVIIQAEHLTKTYHRGSEIIAALNDVSLSITAGEIVACVGPSGSGKTTLLNILGCLDNPTSGRIILAEKTVMGERVPFREQALTKIRREMFGYVFQKFYLIPTLTVEENVVLPFAFFKKPGAEAAAASLMQQVGIEHRKHHLPGQLSGGEMQRVAIARALVNKPTVLLADEPTGNLDTTRTDEIGALFRKLRDAQGLTIVLVTHNLKFAKIADRIVELRDGKIQAS